jgi:hypothetical protein
MNKPTKLERFSIGFEYLESEPSIHQLRKKILNKERDRTRPAVALCKTLLAIGSIN